MFCESNKYQWLGATWCHIFIVSCLIKITHSLWYWIKTFFQVSLTHIEANFLEMMIGKFLMSSIFLCFGFTIIRLQKKSQRMADSKEAFFSYFASCLLQMFMRTIDSSILFRYDINFFELSFWQNNWQTLAKCVYGWPKPNLKQNSINFLLALLKETPQ